MRSGMDIAFFGSSLVSAYWNGAATYYRGIIRALHSRGHRVTFYEPNAYGRQEHRDIADPDWARVVVYSGETEDAALQAVEQARGVDLVVKASGIGIFDTLLEAAVLELQRPETLVVFWDVDAPATLDRIEQDPSDPFRPLIPRYDLVLTYGGGDPVVRAYQSFGARECVPIYNALDPSTHHPVPPDPRFVGDLAFLGIACPIERLGSRSSFSPPPRLCRRRLFLLGGSGWGDKPLPDNVRYVGHVYTRDHNAFNCTPTARAEREPREHGPVRILAAYPGFRSGRCRSVSPHRSLGGHRTVPGARPRDPSWRTRACRLPSAWVGAVSHEGKRVGSRGSSSAYWQSTPTIIARNRWRSSWMPGGPLRGELAG